MRLIVLTVVAALVVGIGVPAAASARAEPDPAGPSVAKKKKKRKAVRCRSNQVPVKVKRRTVGCRSLRAALPAPREGDPRLLLVESALDDDLRGLRDRRGRRAPSLKKLFRKVSPRAYRTVQRAIPRGLARLDRLSAASPSVARSAAAARPLARCAGGPPPTRSDSYSSSSGGQRMTATVTLGAVGTFALQVEGGDYTIRVRISSDECSHFDAPACPTAAGVVDATDSSTNKVSLAVAKGDTVLMSRSFDFSGRTRMHAEVGADAKLDFIDVDDTQTANIELGGTRQQFGPVNLIYTGLHHTRVDMPGRNYVPDLSAVDISLTARGVTVGRSDLGQVGNNIANDLDKGFAALVQTEIANYTSLETAWSVPNTCVKLQFNRDSRTLKLRRGAHGSFSAQAVAAQGGGAAQGSWTRTTQQNASFTPEQVDGAEPRFSYEVTDAGKDIVVANFRVTSKAGVGEGTWEQETEDAPLYRGTLGGTAGETYAPGECGGGWDFTYRARLADIVGADQPFPIIDTDVTGWEGGGARGYDETGNGTYTLEPCNGLPGCSSNLSLDPASDYHVVVLFDAGADTVGVDVEIGGIEYRDCGLSGFVLGSGTFPRSMIGADTITVDLSFGPVDGDVTLTLTRAN